MPPKELMRPKTSQGFLIRGSVWKIFGSLEYEDDFYRFEPGYLYPWHMANKIMLCGVLTPFTDTLFTTSIQPLELHPNLIELSIAELENRK